jgi:predicted acylesterase/phospholipase RssA
MTSRYVAAEKARAARIPFDWTVGHVLSFVPAAVRRFVVREIGVDPQKRLDEDEALLHRNIVRIPEDRAGAEMFDAGELAPLLRDPARPLSRAFARLARVVEGRTVGLALGGGGAWGFAHVALIQTMERTAVPVDYVAGTSIGSVIAGLYTGGGRAALDQLVEENSTQGLFAAAKSPLMRAVLMAMLHGWFLDRFMSRSLRRALGPAIPTLGTTEIPFFAVSTDVNHARDHAELRAGIGWGARASGSLPPVFPPMIRLGCNIVDGAVSASVPSCVLREKAGADFVIASNVVPSMADHAQDGDTRGLLDLISTTFLGRVTSVMRGFFVMGWRAGEDQSQLHADLSLSFESSDIAFWELWKARSIVDRILKEHFTGDDERDIHRAWERFGIERSRTP